VSDVLRIICGDAAEVLAGLEAESIDLCVTSPPYDRLRDYGGHEWDFEKIALELYRVLRKGGVLCWIVGDSTVDGSETLTSAKQKIFFREQCGFRIHDTMIYEKSNPGNPSDAQGRYNQCVEYIFVLSNGRPRTFNPIRDKPNVSFGVMRYGRKTRRDPNGKHNGFFSDRKPAAEFGLRGNCWRGNTAAQEDCCVAREHPAPMPKWLARDLIISWSNPSDVVLDCFAGSGTVAMEAIQLGRRTLAIEINPDYIPIIERSCAVTVGLPI
jgi:DNA modification methylase